MVIALMAGATYAGTSAFFSDTETSFDNIFTAGAIDLQIDNTSYAIDYNIPNYVTPIGEFVANADNSWQLIDLTVEQFFDFVDLKPGDYGEDTISIHVENDSWVCAATQITEDHDNTYSEPELEDDVTFDINNPTGQDGELDDELNFTFWVDDGDNVYESDESIFLSGPLSDVGAAGQIALADTTAGVLGVNTPIPGGTTFYIGKYWCFGDYSEAAVTQDGVNTETPLTVGTGFTCDGASVNNAAQTDTVIGDLEFYAEQSRNNTAFECANWTPTF